MIHHLQVQLSARPFHEKKERKKDRRRAPVFCQCRLSWPGLDAIIIPQHRTPSRKADHRTQTAAIILSLGQQNSVSISFHGGKALADIIITPREKGRQAVAMQLYLRKEAGWQERKADESAIGGRGYKRDWERKVDNRGDGWCLLRGQECQ